VTSADISEGGSLQRPQWSAVFQAGGEDSSPQLSWEGAPSETRSYAIMVYDPDAPTGSGFWHWAVADIPADVTSVAAGAGHAGADAMPAPAVTCQNGTGIRGSWVPRPRPDTESTATCSPCTRWTRKALGLAEDTSPALVGFTLSTHTIALGVLTGYHEQ
jgi:Raf kinase inhibitor-like YbhB/YbcL family protein